MKESFSVKRRRAPPSDMGQAKIRPRLRILVGSQIALGPGKVALLEALSETGSITAAAKRLNMSYMRAWTLIRTMNGCFKKPLVSATHGGPRGGGGASLTPAGRKVLALYQRMDSRCLRAVDPAWKQIQKLLDRGADSKS
jgi:molybdate transport system regulatory protein